MQQMQRPTIIWSLQFPDRITKGIRKQPKSFGSESPSRQTHHLLVSYGIRLTGSNEPGSDRDQITSSLSETDVEGSTGRPKKPYRLNMEPQQPTEEALEFFLFFGFHDLEGESRYWVSENTQGIQGIALLFSYPWDSGVDGATGSASLRPTCWD